MVAVVTVAVVAKVLVWAEAVINMLVEDLVIINVRVGVLADAWVALELLVTVSHSIDVAADVMIDALADLIIGVLSNSSVDVLDTVLEFTMPTSFEELSC